MTVATKKELLKGSLQRYLKADKKEKQKILDELVHHTGMHRKSVIRALASLRKKDPWKEGEKKSGRKVYYGSDVMAALRDVWETSYYICGERLHPVVKEYIRILRRDGDWKHTDEATDKLLKMSLGTMKKRISVLAKTSTQSSAHNTQGSCHF